MPSLKLSKAADVLNHKVSPPDGGRSRGHNTEAKGGLGDQVQSVCHSALSGNFVSSCSTMARGEFGSGE